MPDEDEKQPWYNDSDRMSGLFATLSLLACFWVIFLVLAWVTMKVF